MTYKLTPEQIRHRLNDIRLSVSEVQRQMDPLVEDYESMMFDANQEHIFRAYAMVWAAWWQMTDVMGCLRAAEGRLRDGDGLPADAE